jgi:uncharacterized membrane protein/predicted DsbA family dithiol-disulfide isomerase
MASASSTWVHYQLLQNPSYTSICDVNATVSCTEAYTSRFGSFNGVPVALFGVLFFAFVLGLIAVCARSKTAAPNLPGYVFALSTAGLAVVLYLAYASYFVLHVVCMLCLGTYVAIIGLFLLSGAATRDPMTSLPSRAAKDVSTLFRTPAALSAAVAFVAVAIAAVVLFPSEPVTAAAAPAEVNGEQAPGAMPTANAAQVQQLEQYLAAQPRVPIIVPSDGAAVVIVKFNDYQCPPCRQTYMNYKPILAKYQAQAPGKVLFITKQFPLDQECNANVTNGPHPLACEAAAGVTLARQHGQAEKLEDWLFANQPTLTLPALKQAIRDVGGVPDFDQKYAQTLEQIKTDIAMGKLLGVSATPTFFVNGVKIAGGLPPEYFDDIIAYQLRKASEQK